MIRCEAKKSLTPMKLSKSSKSTSLSPLPISCQALAFVLFVVMSHFAAAANNLKVDIIGAEDEVLENIRKSLSIVAATKRKNKPDPSDQTIRQLHNKAQKEIKQAVAPFGFYQATINQSLNKHDEQWQALYSIELGLQVKIQKVSVIVSGPGEDETAVNILTNNLPFKEGDNLEHQLYTNYKQTLFDTLFDLGYIDTKYEKSELRVDIENQKATVILNLASGSKYFFGDVKIKQTVVADALIEKLIVINDKTPFNTDRLIELQLRLTDTGYFANTEVNIEKEKVTSQYIPVIITTTPSKKLKYTSSVGFGTDTGPRVGFGVLNRRVNPQGHNLRFSTRLSKIESELNANYKIPMGNINNESLDFFTRLAQEDINDAESLQYSIGSALNKNLWDGRARFSLTLLKDKFSFGDEPSQTADLLIPGITYSYLKAKNALFAQKGGYSLLADIHGGIESSITDTTFFYSKLVGRTVIPLNNRARLLNRFDLGYIATKDFGDLPPSERFFTGGGQTVRGYGYKDIGDRDNAGNNIGGQYLAAMSVEVDYLPWKNYGAAIFFDAGDVSTEARLDLKKAAGIGFRYRSIIGLVRLDFAHPFDDPDEDFRFHVSIGPDL